MAFDFKLPDIGEGVVEGEIVRWLVKEGEAIKEDQPMVEVMTDKATVEIPAPKAGRVAKRMYKEGEKCPVGKVLISIDTDGASAPAAKAGARAPAPGPTSNPALGMAANVPTKMPARPAPPAPPKTNGQGADTSVLATPATRKLARELGVDLSAVTGTGPSGRITSEDVKNHGNGSRAVSSDHPTWAPVPAGQGDVRVPFRGLRKKIAENMTRSVHTAAHFTYVEEVDVTDLVSLRERANQRYKERGLKLSYLPFIIKAVVDALKKFPQLNATLDETAGEIVQRRHYHIGMAAATKDGLIVPVVRDADRRSVIGIAQEIDRLAEVTKAGKATREDLTGSTFTITSLGQLGGVLATPIINFPEVAILGVHKIAKRPAVHGNEIAVRDLMNLSISVDHRLVDGHDAALFVAEIKQSLETPGLLFLEAV